jgi:hypothetical protein
MNHCGIVSNTIYMCLLSVTLFLEKNPLFFYHTNTLFKISTAFISSLVITSPRLKINRCRLNQLGIKNHLKSFCLNLHTLFLVITP